MKASPTPCRVAVLVLGCALTACASTKPTAAAEDVSELVGARAGLDDVAWTARKDADAQADVDRRVTALLASPLTTDSAMRIALLNNRELAATIEDLGIAQADLVEAGLLANPTISGDIISSTQGNGLGGGLGLSQSLLSALLIPAKKRVAKAELEHTIVSVTQSTLTLLRDVKVAYAGVQAAVANRNLQRTLVQTAEVADEYARRMLEAGNTTELERELFAADLDEARLGLNDASLDVTMARETLNQHLGLWGGQIHWRLVGLLPEPPKTEAELARVEQFGIAQRLDLSAARFHTESIDYALQLRRRGLVPEVEVGVEAGNEVGNDAGHEWVVGPTLSIEIPIFDPGHADLARLGAQLRQSQHRQQSMAIHARSEIRGHRASLLSHREQALYLRDTVLPRRNTLGQRALERYNAMLIGAFELLEVRAGKVKAQRDYVEALHAYWVARAELELAVGGHLPSP